MDTTTLLLGHKLYRFWLDDILSTKPVLTSEILASIFVMRENEKLYLPNKAKNQSHQFEDKLDCPT